jgi:hypothetical protein
MCDRIVAPVPKPKLKVVKVDDGFVVQDENGYNYGLVTKDRKKAEEILKDWKTYYDDVPEAKKHD